ncbi:hypothetical protein ACFSKU_02885 [Pontibacter silvestris]|uniref:Uncharacterized protein n=1 Tax=Pontibacter silvestris TaxID=2305183 RepID=A0ABW4WSY2_9BACT|nr:hypothetical protein [Pontibacter silvestris]MCC9138423.1 hypothetical protein [Pontibacter silvestris]
MRDKVGFVKTTGWFSLVGLFIPRFMAIEIIGLQSLISLFGVECVNSLSLLWSITIAGSVILPGVFFRFIQRTSLESEALRKWLIFFNIVEPCLTLYKWSGTMRMDWSLYLQLGLLYLFCFLSIIYQQVHKAKLEKVDSEQE